MTPKIDKIFRKVLSGELCANFGGPAGGSRTLTGAELQNLIAPLWRPSRKAWFAGGARLFFLVSQSDSESLLCLKSNTGAGGIRFLR